MNELEYATRKLMFCNSHVGTWGLLLNLCEYKRYIVTISIALQIVIFARLYVLRFFGVFVLYFYFIA